VAFGEYAALLRDLRATPGSWMRLEIALRGPGWRAADGPHADISARR
jgi:hypothetical protein